MFTQKESQYTAQLVWHDWFPTVWLDEHQMGSNGPRIFVMPATDPINPNVHPVIYRWNGILGQSQAAALEAAGKDGHHLQLHLHELLGRGDGVERLVAQPDRPAHGGRQRPRRGPVDQSRAVRGASGAGVEAAAAAASFASTRRCPPPTDIDAAHRVPAAVDGRPLDAARHRRLRDDLDDGAARDGRRSARDHRCGRSYEVNRQTVEEGKTGDPHGDPGSARAPARRRARRRTWSTAETWAASRSIAPTRRSTPTTGTTTPAPSSSR